MGLRNAMTPNLSLALRLILAVVAVALAVLWLVDIVWYVVPTGAGVDFGDFVWLAGGAVAGAFAGVASRGRQTALLCALGGIVLLTIAAFLAMPYDVEGEGGGLFILFWAAQAVVALLCGAGVAYLWRTVR